MIIKNSVTALRRLYHATETVWFRDHVCRSFTSSFSTDILLPPKTPLIVNIIGKQKVCQWPLSRENPCCWAKTYLKNENAALFPLQDEFAVLSLQEELLLAVFLDSKRWEQGAGR